MRWRDRVLDAFSSWFASAAGVYQTTVATFAIVLIEVVRPDLDQHGFWLLYWLTVYSAVTQPALAYVGRKSMELLTVVLNRIAEMVGQLHEILREVREVLSMLRCMCKDDFVMDTETLRLVRRMAEKLEVG
ncbi:MAG: hypothetical protein RBS21_05475 [Corynebacterium sp.]|nr:hypothetical protein [Corynebacterium sp.]